MKPGGSRRKGAAFERQVAKLILGAFRSFGIEPGSCYRAPASGGHRFVAKDHPGDLVFTGKLERIFPWVVECKNQRVTTIEHFFLLRETNPEYKWLMQAQRQAKAITPSRRPLLVFKSARLPGVVFCTFPSVALTHKFKHNESLPKQVVVGSRSGKALLATVAASRIYFPVTETPWMLLRFTDFLEFWKLKVIAGR